MDAFFDDISVFGDRQLATGSLNSNHFFYQSNRLVITSSNLQAFFSAVLEYRQVLWQQEHLQH
jgi:hypothetical protein